MGAALKAAGVPINDQNLIRALEEAAGARGGNPSREDVVRARSGAHDYKVAPRPDSDGGSSGSEDSARPREPRQQEIKPQTAVASITFNSALAQMNKKPIQAMRVLESMRVSMPDVAALQRMDQLRNGGSFTLPKEPEEVVRTLCQVAPDAGRPPPEVVGAALKAAGLPATEENLEKALHEALGHRPSSEDSRLRGGHSMRRLLRRCCVLRRGSGSHRPKWWDWPCVRQEWPSVRTRCGEPYGRPGITRHRPMHCGWLWRPGHFRCIKVSPGWSIPCWPGKQSEAKKRAT